MRQQMALEKEQWSTDGTHYQNNTQELFRTRVNRILYGRGKTKMNNSKYKKNETSI